MRAVHYFYAWKQPWRGEAIAKGFGAVKVPIEGAKLQPGALHLIGGLGFGSLELLRQARQNREPYVFFDRAYFGGGPKTNRLRVVPGAYQKHWLDYPLPGRRIEVFGVKREPWRNGGTHIMLVPPGDTIQALFGLHDWEHWTLTRLKRCTDRPVMVNYKRDPVPLAERLRDCHCVVTWTSNTAVDAIMAGLPAIVAPESAAVPVAHPLVGLESSIESDGLWQEPDRAPWAESLAWGQFTIEEIASGFAREVIMENYA